MWLAEQTSNYVKAPIHVVVLKNNGLHFENQKTINSIDQKVRLFTAAFESQFLACSDTGLQGPDFANRLTEFGKTVVLFRQDFISEWIGRAIDKGLDRVVESWNAVPSGTTIVTVPITPEVDKSIREQQERAAKAVRETCPHVQEMGTVFSNLKALRAALQRELNPPSEGSPTEEERNSMAQALTEIAQAAMMGPFTISQDQWFLVARVADAMPVSREEYKNPRLHSASVALRIAVIEQAIAILENGSE